MPPVDSEQAPHQAACHFEYGPVLRPLGALGFVDELQLGIVLDGEMRRLEQAGLQRGVALFGKRSALLLAGRLALRRTQSAVADRVLLVGKARRVAGFERPKQGGHSW